MTEPFEGETNPKNYNKGYAQPLRTITNHNSPDKTKAIYLAKRSIQARNNT